MLLGCHGGGGGGVGMVADGISESCVRGRYCIIVAVWGGGGTLGGRTWH